MKRIISLLLSILTIFTLVFAVSGCTNSDGVVDGGLSSDDVVGVWRFVGEEDPWTQNFVYGQLYMYVYKDGTRDMYGKDRPGMNPPKEPRHMNASEWHIEGDYFVVGEEIKYTMDGDSLYDKQEKLTYVKVSDDTSVDIEITIE